MNQNTTLTNVRAIITANPELCYRALARVLDTAYRTDRDLWEPELCAARPDCGYDCDERCPVTGAPVDE